MRAQHGGEQQYFCVQDVCTTTYPHNDEHFLNARQCVCTTAVVASGATLCIGVQDYEPVRIRSTRSGLS